MKKKIYDIIVVGSGLSSLTFVDSYLEKNKKIDIISFRKTKKKFPQINNKHILKILPPQMIGEEKQVLDYFSINRILVKSDVKFFGSLEFGGLSNYWGLQIDKNIKDDISKISKKTQKKILNSFVEIFNKQNLLGEIDENHQNLFEKNSYIDQSFLKRNKTLKNEEPLLAFQKKGKKQKINLNSINEKNDSLTANNYFKKYLKNKKINFCFLHTTSLYPTPDHLVRLDAINELKKNFKNIEIGYSDHTIGKVACLSAISMGANIIEKHFTDSKKRIGPDIICSMDEKELASIIETSKKIFRQKKGKKSYLKDEQVTRNFAYASIVASKAIKQGEKFTYKNLSMKRPGTGYFKYVHLKKIINKFAKKNIIKNHQLKKSDV